MKILALQLVVFAVMCAVSWYPGNRLVWFTWTKLAARAQFPGGKPSKLSGPIGGLERVLYIFGVMSGQYQLITGWLVMKAFFGWIKSESAADVQGGSVDDGTSAALDRFNSFLIGNLLSLLIGLACGVGGNFVVRLIGSCVSGPVL
ncbi:MAG TPA: hypothetical protein VNZ48_13720 [Xanthobacteraceae bacterium]|jgi:hypothetical protein|nr:hypothetical protein [Xanthobacteraceae bacterium]